VALRFSLPPELPTVQVDEPSLERILANLLVNALAATPAGGEIRVEGRQLNGPLPQVELTVADTGRGISPEDREHLFEKFRLRRTQGDGSGLGLYICKTLVEANQGRIWVESETGRGTVFHLAFPLAPAIELGAAAAGGPA
jgi:signal transduction histidine kinase